MQNRSNSPFRTTDHHKQKLLGIFLFTDQIKKAEFKICTETAVKYYLVLRSTVTMEDTFEILLSVDSTGRFIAIQTSCRGRGLLQNNVFSFHD